MRAFESPLAAFLLWSAPPTVCGLAGIGMSNDAYHITAPEPDGEGSARAIDKALRSGDLSPLDIGHVNAHATSTPVGDLAESKTIRRALGDHPVVTATKSMTGHLLGAAGAVESIATMLAIRDGVIPGTRNLDNLDPEIELDGPGEVLAGLGLVPDAGGPAGCL